MAAQLGRNMIASSLFFAMLASTLVISYADPSAVLWMEDPPPDGPSCAPLSRAHLSRFALNKTLLITVVDRLVMQTFGRSWVENVKSAGISYWMVAALDPWTSKLLGHWGVKSCFNAPLERLRYNGSGGWDPPKLIITSFHTVYVLKWVWTPSSVSHCAHSLLHQGTGATAGAASTGVR